MDPYHQSAVIAYQHIEDQLKVLLITSSKGKRWVLPKGIVEPELAPAASAAKEAWEEAGIKGQVSDQVLGSYAYEKWGGVCRVEVFAMRVDAVAESWPENYRQRLWEHPHTAAELVHEPELQTLLRNFPDLLAHVEDVC